MYCKWWGGEWSSSWGLSISGHTRRHTHSMQYVTNTKTVTEQLKYTSCQAPCFIKSLAKSAAGWLTTISETSIFREALQFLLIACKERQQNLKNDCPHTEILPYHPQHLEDTQHSSWNLIVLKAFVKFQNHQKDVSPPEYVRMKE